MTEIIDDRTPQQRLLSRLRGSAMDGGTRGGLFLQPEELRFLLDLLAGDDRQTARQIRFKISDHVAVCAGEVMSTGPLDADTPLDIRALYGLFGDEFRELLR